MKIDTATWEIGDDYIPVIEVIKTRMLLDLESEAHTEGEHIDNECDDCPRCADEPAYLATAISEVEEQLYGDLGPFGSETLILDSAFTDRIREEWEHFLGEPGTSLNWPLCCIDWGKAAEQRKPEFLEVRFGPLVYLVRG
jgi:hypothetical protein